MRSLVLPGIYFTSGRERHTLSFWSGILNLRQNGFLQFRNTDSLRKDFEKVSDAQNAGNGISKELISIRKIFSSSSN